MTNGPLLDVKVARELFRTASIWRGAVIGGAACTVLALLFAPSAPRPTASYTPPPPARPTGAPPAPPPQAAASAPQSQPAAPAIPTSSTTAPLAPVAPAVPRIAPGAKADQIVDEPAAKKDGQFGEAKEGEQPDGHIKPGQALDPQ